MDAKPMPRILIVDDEPRTLYATEMLLYDEPYEVLFADCGASALALIAVQPPDVIVLDVMMPDMSGYEVAAKLKADPDLRAIPIILATALGRKEDVISGLEAGADEFLTKPIHGPELRARIRTMLRIKQQYDELQDNLRLREEMADMIVHDMRSPISALHIFIELLQRIEDLPPDALRLSERIRTQAYRLNSFLGDLLLMAKMNAGKLALQRSYVDPAILVEITAEQYREMAASRDIKLALDLPDKAGEVLLDVRLMERVLDNLVSNALKYAPSGTAVTLRLAYPPAANGAASGAQRMRLQVIDQGPGIPEEYQESIFDKYEVVHTQRDHGPQVGLGLALCKSVVDAHDGSICVTNQEPSGAVFTLEI